MLGTIKPGRVGRDRARVGPGASPRVDCRAGPDANPFLDVLRTSLGDREEDQGELRLVAWVSGTSRGQVIEPAIDRKRGFTAVLVHLRSGPPPSPDGKRYNLLLASADQSVRPELSIAVGPLDPSLGQDQEPRGRKPAAESRWPGTR